MDEQPKRIRQFLALLWLPPAVIVMVPVVIFLAFAIYLRATAIGVMILVRFALKTRHTSTAIQGPHLLRVNVGAKKGQESSFTS